MRGPLMLIPTKFWEYLSNMLWNTWTVNIKKSRHISYGLFHTVRERSCGALSARLPVWVETRFVSSTVQHLKSTVSLRVFGALLTKIISVENQSTFYDKWDKNMWCIALGVSYRGRLFSGWKILFGALWEKKIAQPSMEVSESLKGHESVSRVFWKRPSRNFWLFVCSASFWKRS